MQRAPFWPGLIARVGDFIVEAGISRRSHRLHARFPDLKILVGRWGVDDPDDRIRYQLIAAGAQLVVTRLGETRDQVPTLAPTVTQEPELAPDGGSAVPEPRVASA